MDSLQEGRTVLALVPLVLVVAGVQALAVVCTLL
jgi:hypothetical protein